MAPPNQAIDHPDHDTPAQGIGRRGFVGSGIGVVAALATGALPTFAAAQDTKRTPGPVTASDPIWLGGIPNGRDLGGFRVPGGKRIRRGIMLRTAALAGATPAGLSLLERMGVKDIVDLRTDAEIKAQPDPAVKGAAEVYLNILADEKAAAGAANITSVQGTVEQVEQTMVQSYRDFITLKSATDGYHQFLNLALEGKPFAFHCTEGKDRTGWGAALLLHLLGASRAQINADYMLSNTGLIEQNAALERMARKMDPNVNLAVMKPELTVSMTYLDAAYDEANKQYGSLDNYIRNALGFTAKDSARLRAVYLRA